MLVPDVGSVIVRRSFSGLPALYSQGELPRTKRTFVSLPRQIGSRRLVKPLPELHFLWGYNWYEQ